ncbi:hypothetical protein [Bacillus phage vB_BtM_BMBsp2]|nr:hypothetical protein [Bacillus phage vB_BtM_BMBsp2]
MKINNLWNNIFKVEMNFSNGEKKTIYFHGSLKGAIRDFLKTYKDLQVVANFSILEGSWLKEIGL